MASEVQGCRGLLGQDHRILRIHYVYAVEPVAGEPVAVEPVAADEAQEKRYSK